LNTVVTTQRPRHLLAVGALFLGAVAIATSPLFVRLAETGPVATAFWRVFLALPFLWLWGALSQRRTATNAGPPRRAMLIAAGLFFAGDLAFWHWSILRTSVANSTLLANLAPIFVTLAAWLIFRKRPGGRFLIGLAVALTGMVVLIGGNFRPSSSEMLGNLFGVITAMFYAGYQIAVTRARERASTSTVMAWSVSITAATLLPIALLSGEVLFPATVMGWANLWGLALIAQVAGQSLIAYAMAHLAATFSSVGLLLQPVMAALFAWVLLGETVTALQIAGGIAVLIGIRIVHQSEQSR
jgi:drug/metabolite transporter (DMT)-like permease